MNKLLTNGLSLLICFFFCCGTAYCQTDTTAANDGPVADSFRYPGKLRVVPEDAVKAYQRDPAFAYANDPSYWEKKPASSPAWLNGILRFLFSQVFLFSFFICLLALVAFGLYRLARENSFTWFRKASPGESGSKLMPEDEDSIDLDEAIRKHAATGDYKMAVHYMYLKVIRAALEKNLTTYNPSSTNAEITRAFRDPQRARDFRYLATAYEYIFFGDFVLNPDQFSSLEEKFSQFHQNATR